jgi:hypothetical protein
MQRFDAFRRPSHWLRALLVGLVLAFALNTVAHASHEHELVGSVGTAHGLACGYCTTFGGVADLPVCAFVVPIDVRTDLEFSHRETLPPLARPVSTARARAPPRY